MESNNIGVDVRAKMVKKSGGAFPFLFASPLETAQSFKEAIIEYSVDKLIDIAENKVIVDDLSYIFARLDTQFASKKEQEEFYQNYVFCILSQYGELVGKSFSWIKSYSLSTGKSAYPLIEEDRFITHVTTPNKQSAIWLFKEYERKLKKQEQKNESHHNGHNWKNEKTYTRK